MGGGFLLLRPPMAHTVNSSARNLPSCQFGSAGAAGRRCRRRRLPRAGRGVGPPSNSRRSSNPTLAASRGKVAVDLREGLEGFLAEEDEAGRFDLRVPG